MVLVGALRRRLGFLVIITTVLGAATPAGPARAATEDEKKARALYESAEKNFDVGKFAEALTDYQAAYEAKPLPGFLFNIAQCYRNMGNYERARFFFRRYLALDPRAPNHRRVEELIAEMSKQIDAQAAAAPPSATAPPPATTTPPPEATTPPPDATPPTPPPPTAAVPSPIVPPPSAVAAPASSDTSAEVAAVVASPPPEPRRPVWKRWWFWTGVGAVVVGGAVAAFFLTRPETRTPGTLDPINGRGTP
jgi:hypothetical protein